MRLYAYSEELRLSVNRALFEESWLVEANDVKLRLADNNDAPGLVELYKSAYLRGDWFGDRSHDLDPHKRAESFVQRLLNSTQTTNVVFTTGAGSILGATILDFNTRSGVLIDETQIDPVLGRRRGIMSAYFRRIVPILSANAPFWTEFILTPESRVLRRVLINELGMVVTGLRPSSHQSGVVGLTRSSLLAEGLTIYSQVAPFAAFVAATREEHALLNTLTGAEPQVSDTKLGPARINLSPAPFAEALLANKDISAREILSRKGWLPIGVNIHNQEFIYAKWPHPNTEDLGFVAEEGIRALSALVAYIQQLSLQRS